MLIYVSIEKLQLTANNIIRGPLMSQDKRQTANFSNMTIPNRHGEAEDVSIEKVNLARFSRRPVFMWIKM